LRSVSTFETSYLQRSTARLNELIGTTFANSAATYFGSGESFSIELIAILWTVFAESDAD